MFDKILIANRGEIACRIIKTARRLNIQTVAVYSDADRDALHVRQADQAVHLGPPPSTESYLLIEKIIAACQQTGAQAVHPGYGFLSENADFASALQAAGISFIGPGVKAITQMGDKITSKKLAQKAGVNTIPGFTGVIEDSEHAITIAREIGYPVMLKASAGGGGKGMRVVFNDAECRDGFERASSEALSSFGDARVFAEKFIENPRHIEIQIIGDQHGNIIHLGERECSLQRRHQKVIEEAPSPFLDPATRASMGAQAIALAKAVEYNSAGTVEFVVDADKNFYFLEMNTRLQVEHPVTEMITGVDLVELMLHSAAGEALTLSQDEVELRGWALETRIYAEDPARNFMPSIGRLVHYQAPTPSAAIRIDTGVEEGAEVSMFYDPMIAKLVSYGEDRAQAINTMSDALDEYYIRGVSHNIGFLSALVNHPRFREGAFSTHFIAEEFPDGYDPLSTEAAAEDLLIAVAAIVGFRDNHRAAKLSGQLSGYEHSATTELAVVIDSMHHRVSVSQSHQHYRVRFDDRELALCSPWQLGQALFHATVDGISQCLQIDYAGPGYRITHRGLSKQTLAITQRTAQLHQYMLDKVPPDLSKFLLSPMPGLLVTLAVKPGQKVKAGEELAVVEAMKMENSLRASEDLIVSKVLAKEGDSLTVDQAIIEFE